MIILGIDPGTLKTGYGVIEFKNNKYTLLDFGVIKTNSKANLTSRLHKIYEHMFSISSKWCPDVVSIENIFVKENIRSALLLGHARGAAICGAKFNNLNKGPSIFFDFSPREIKRGLVGNGSASKDQVSFMVKTILNEKVVVIPEDASDALAAAIFAANNVVHRDAINFNNNLKENVL